MSGEKFSSMYQASRTLRKVGGLKKVDERLNSNKKRLHWWFISEYHPFFVKSGVVGGRRGKAPF